MRSFIHLIVAAFIFVSAVLPLMPAYSADLVLPAPGTMAHISPPFQPPVLKGVKIHPHDPLKFDFILDSGSEGASSSEAKRESLLAKESTELIKYFLAGLTIPEQDLWVNLSPYERDRVIEKSFGRTEMGRNLLAQDYLLKQLAASLLHPDADPGRRFWEKVYQEAQHRLGTRQIPVNTFNKVWIVPDKAVIFENESAGTAYIGESSLKVLLEEDYLALKKQGPARRSDPTAAASQVLRDVIVPVLNTEVNSGKNFAPLRQVYNSLILAAWYKKKIKKSMLSRMYADQKKIQGLVSQRGSEAPEVIYNRYIEAFKKGAYNYIKEDMDPATGHTMPRKYFSGGFHLRLSDQAMTVKPMSEFIFNETEGEKRLDIVQVDLEAADSAMVSANPGEMNQQRAGYYAENFLKQLPDLSGKKNLHAVFPNIPPSGLLKKMIEEGQLSRDSVLAVLKHLIIEVSMPDYVTRVEGVAREEGDESKYITALTFTRRQLDHISSIVLARLKPNAQRPDIYPPKRLKQILQDKVILITGGSGYVSPAIAKSLVDVGARVVVHSRQAVDWKDFVAGDDRVAFVEGELVEDELAQAMLQHRVEAVVHLAGMTKIEESMRMPSLYVSTNAIGTLQVKNAMIKAKVKKIAFASSTMVYSGTRFNRDGRLDETIPLDPKNLYGATKLMSENIIKEASVREGLSSVILRFTNVAGDFEWTLPDGRSRRFGERQGTLRLIPVLSKIANLLQYFNTNGKKPGKELTFRIMGNQHPTYDGTTVRDFIHPLDAADAYVRSLAHLFDEGDSLVINLGTRTGASVKEILDLFNTETEQSIPVKVVKERKGDPSYLRVDPARANLHLAWESRHDIREIIHSAWEHELSGRDPKARSAETNEKERADREKRLMRDILDKMRHPSAKSLSDESKFQILFYTFIYSLNEDFPIDKQDNENLSPNFLNGVRRSGADLLRKAQAISLGPAGLRRAVQQNLLFMRELINYGIRLDFLEQETRLHSGIYKIQADYIDAILKYLKTMQPLGLPKAVRDARLKKEQRIIDSLKNRKVMAGQEMEQLRRSLKDEQGQPLELSWEEYSALIRHWVREGHLPEKIVPVFERKDGDFEIVRFEIESQARGELYYWLAASNVYLFGPKGHVYLRVLEDSQQLAPAGALVEIGQTHIEAAKAEALASMKVHVEDADLKPFNRPILMSYTDSVESPGEKKSAEAPRVYGAHVPPVKGNEHYKGNEHRLAYAMAIKDENSLQVWRDSNRGLVFSFSEFLAGSREHALFVEVDPRELVDFYEEALNNPNVPLNGVPPGLERFAPELRASLADFEFRTWLVSQADPAQMSPGGIDFKDITPDTGSKDAGEWDLDVDPMHMAQWRHASGFKPVIRTIRPLDGLAKFLN